MRCVQITKWLVYLCRKPHWEVASNAERRLIKRRFIKMSHNQGANKSGCRVHALHSLTHSGWLAVNFIRAAWKRCSLPRYASRNAPSNIKKAILSAARTQFSAKRAPRDFPRVGIFAFNSLPVTLRPQRALAFNSKCKASIHLRFSALIFSRFEERAHKYREEGSSA